MESSREAQAEQALSAAPTVASAGDPPVHVLTAWMHRKHGWLLSSSECFGSAIRNCSVGMGSITRKCH